MADIRAFRGYRYDLGRIGALSNVIAPPYDVIDPTLQDTLYSKSEHNVVRVDFAREHSSDSETDNRYTRSAATLKDWLREDVLVQDSARSLYVYHQDFEVEGHRYTRKGFLARVRLEPFGRGRIYPHEETLSGPKADRLKLFAATAHEPQPDLRPVSRPGKERCTRSSKRPSAGRCRCRRPITSASSAACGRSPISTRSVPWQD